MNKNKFFLRQFFNSLFGLIMIFTLIPGCKQEDGGDDGPDTDAPVSVMEFTAAPHDDDGKVNLSWLTPVDRDFTMISITFTPEDPDVEQPINIMGMSNTTMGYIVEDLEVAGTYEFTITATDASGNVSDAMTTMGQAGGLRMVACVRTPIDGTMDDHSCVRDGATEFLPTPTVNRRVTLGGMISPRRDIDYFAVTAPSGATYIRVQTLGSLDTYGWVENDGGPPITTVLTDVRSGSGLGPNGLQLVNDGGGNTSCTGRRNIDGLSRETSCNDDGGIGYNFIIRADVTAGDRYYIRVKSWNECCEGSYSLEVAFYTGRYNPPL